jgi:hypothetical protein
MRYPRSFKPESIANVDSQIQIVDTPKSFDTRINTGSQADSPEINRTLVTSFGEAKEVTRLPGRTPG